MDEIEDRFSDDELRDLLTRVGEELYGRALTDIERRRIEDAIKRRNEGR